MFIKRYVESDSMPEFVRAARTEFLSGSGHLDFIKKHFYPEWEAEAAFGLRARHIRIWSVGSSGHEGPYALAMTLLERFPARSGWRIQILSIDGPGETPKPETSACAQEACTDGETPAAVPGGGSDPIIEFHRIDVRNEKYPLGSPFDLIWRGNVLIYFDYQSMAGLRGRAGRQASPARSKTPTK